MRRHLKNAKRNIKIPWTLSRSGIPTTIIPDNTYQWDGDRSYGQGYYRVPKTMITDIDGNKIQFADIMPNVGIIQSNNCSKNVGWNAIMCHDIKHRVMG